MSDAPKTLAGKNIFGTALNLLRETISAAVRPLPPYGAAGSLITLLLWVYYSSQILLFGAEFTQVYADYSGAPVEPGKHAVRVEQKQIELPEN